MRPISNELLALISGTEFKKADLYTITLQNGSVLRFTDYDVSIVIGGNTFLADSIVLDRTKIKNATGLEVNELTITAYSTNVVTIGGIPFLKFCEQGGLDGALVKLERCFMAEVTDTSAGSVTLFSGRVATVDVTRSKATITVKAWTELLNAQMPRNLIQPSCVHTLYDGGCKLIKAAFGVASVVADGSSQSQLLCALAQVSGYFDLGTIGFTSGANNGLTRSVKSYTVGVINLSFPLPSAPAPGDAFTVFPGCDKTQATCTNKFNNLVNFRGFPYVPVAEMAQ